VAYYDLYIGTTIAGSYDIANIQHTSALRSGAVTIPSQGKTVYVRLSSDIGGAWTNADYTFTEQPAAAAVLTSATSGVLGTSQTFTWTAGSGVAYYDLLVGTRGVGSYDLDNIQHTTALSSGAPTIPSQGKTVYVRLSPDIGGT